MKKKFTRSSLFVLAACLWIYILYNFYNDTHQKNMPSPAMANRPEKEKPLVSEYQLQSSDYRDPFLSILTDTLSTRMPDTTRIKVAHANYAPRPMLKKEPLPDYFGTVNNGKEKVAILKLNNNNLILQAGDTIPGYKIKSITPDSIILLHKQSHAAVTIKISTH